MATLATGLVGSLYDFSDAMARVCDVSTFVMVVVVLVLVLHCLADRFEGAWRLWWPAWSSRCFKADKDSHAQSLVYQYNQARSEACASLRRVCVYLSLPVGCAFAGAQHHGQMLCHALHPAPGSFTIPFSKIAARP